MTNVSTPRALLAGLLTGGLLAVPALLFSSALASPTATAHVRVSADHATEGSFSQLTFRVPTESDTAGTVKVQITLPTDRPLTYVSTKPVPGWTARVVEAKLPQPVVVNGTTLTKAARTVTWTASGAANAIKPGEYQEFSISAGPLTGVGDLVLPAVQTYSDGTVVAWDEPPVASGAEPEHPAPVLTVVAATGSGAAGSAPAAAAAEPDLVARGLGVAGLVLGVAAVVVASIAVRRVAVAT